MLEISEADIVESLRRDNPWWELGINPTAREIRHKRAYFAPFCELVLKREVKRSVVLMGPRRVGKTVMLQQLVDAAIASGVPSTAIFFVSVDTPLYNGIALDRLLNYFEKQTKHDAGIPRIVIFDEIQYLKNWEVHLKVLTDRYPQTRFVASGSAAAALRLKSQESGAGRFTDFFLPPLTFAEFLMFRGREEQLVKAHGNDRLRRFKANDIEKLNEEFINYLNFGGYPEAVLSEQIRSDIHRYLGRDIVDKVLLRDLPSLYGIQDIPELNRLFTTIAYHTAQEISLDALAQNSGVAKNTIGRYLDYLEAAFLIVRVRRVDDTGRTFQRMRRFKVYLTNPTMRSALFAPVKDGDDAMGAMAETALFSQWFHSDQMRNIYYARWKRGRRDLEVDLVRVDPGIQKPVWAYEVKWSDRYASTHPDELVGLVDFAKSNSERGIPVGATSKTISRVTELDGIEIRHFPCSLHCYQIGKNVTEGRAP